MCIDDDDDEQNVKLSHRKKIWLKISPKYNSVATKVDFESDYYIHIFIQCGWMSAITGQARHHHHR
ncbi:hypothetical protein DERP_010516 [Dermatophagoides pteronyssinus]|uniref:Uncharacterized protein n=1 Tax=Dermatophagoides pteronyssinus TaxID=6956 RepID=A0ABQ8JFK4_DERPT|nr:hypothetical protein DERP_010516 [Dermatophagoides pteronyssinus]